MSSLEQHQTDLNSFELQTLETTKLSQKSLIIVILK